MLFGHFLRPMGEDVTQELQEVAVGDQAGDLLAGQLDTEFLLELARHRAQVDTVALAELLGDEPPYRPVAFHAAA